MDEQFLGCVSCALLLISLAENRNLYTDFGGRLSCKISRICSMIYLKKSIFGLL
jgi:hypothetical protein